FRGRDEIAGWSRREASGVNQTFDVTDVRAAGDAVIVAAEVGGAGFNGPSTFTFRLAPGGAAIERMTITG
ncbi:MAG TPA: nuclear transport factor 2 family protein, partial [Agromyces mariniharenae]|nr:nuclear transport factor 2 family protein [Agromyces mariniharenae]